MKKIIAPLLLALLPLAPATQAIEYREEMAPPNVAFFIELQGTRTDFDNLGGDDKDGVRIRLGLDLQDVKIGGWMLRTEMGLNQFGKSRLTTSSSVLNNTDPSIYETVTDNTRQLRLSGIELGLRLYDNRFLYVRGGAFVYSLKSRLETTITDLDINGAEVGPPNTQTPQEETISGVGPYIGAGLEIPLVESAKAVAEFNVYQVDSETLNNISVGFRFSF